MLDQAKVNGLPLRSVSIPAPLRFSHLVANETTVLEYGFFFSHASALAPIEKTE
jgi:hypothetical protein